jgi:mono/diheme cytochrome c family protein
MNLLLKSSLSAVAVATLALGSVFGAAYELRQRAAKMSHQQPTTEDWFEVPTATSPALRATGKKLFLHDCAHCHGIDATGDEGPDLHDLQVSDRYILNTIARGVPHEMPSFAKKVSDPDAVALLAYLRSLSTTAATD